MSGEGKSKIGTVGWRDLTVPDAESVRGFYESVVGWKSEPVSMGEYSDFTMIPPESQDGIAGICHARGSNADLPAQWLLYFIVEDVDRSAARCVELGGEILAGPRGLGGARFCVIRDPAGAVCALYQE